jgi:hypothetical protein
MTSKFFAMIITSDLPSNDNRSMKEKMQQKENQILNDVSCITPQLQPQLLIYAEVWDEVHWTSSDQIRR